LSLKRRCLTAAALLLCTVSAAFAAEVIGRVVGVYDGDTLTLVSGGAEQHKIRLAGIDAPEKRQPFSQQSKERLSILVFDRIVRVTWNKRDRYGRIVGKVFLNDVDVNLEMVASGLAWHYRRYQIEQSIADRRKYALAENRARSAHLGLWRELKPVPPWEYRRRVK
jgi:endonuclease YncB( thermonuclease family)